MRLARQSWRRPRKRSCEALASRSPPPCPSSTAAWKQRSSGATGHPSIGHPSAYWLEAKSAVRQQHAKPLARGMNEFHYTDECRGRSRANRSGARARGAWVSASPSVDRLICSLHVSVHIGQAQTQLTSRDRPSGKRGAALPGPRRLVCPQQFPPSGRKPAQSPFSCFRLAFRSCLNCFFFTSTSSEADVRSALTSKKKAARSSGVEYTTEMKTPRSSK